ncbi:MAG: HD domain-containing protein [Desulfuromonas sp.]|nr:HD domain-containing protein [Desulfuromonas sp.]
MNDRQALLQNFIRTLAIAMANANLYSVHHPQVVQLCKTAQELHQTLLADQSGIRLMIIHRELIIDDMPLSPSLHQQRLSKAMANCGVSHIELRRGLTTQELALLVVWLCAETTQPPPDCERIRCGSVTVRYNETGDHSDFAPNEQHSQLEQNYTAQELDRFMEIYAAVKNQQQLNMVGLGDMVSSFIDALQFNAEPLLALAPLRQMDDYTFVHSTNVCLLNIAQARSLGIEGAQLHDIGIAALLHDVGKQFIPSEILNKPGKLDADEWKLMQEHPQRGALYLLENPGVPRLAVVTAFEHHMRFDQRGYPRLHGEWTQNLSSQMTAISDVFDALRTSRSYRKALEPDEIKKIFLEMSGSDLHPGLTQNFLSLFDAEPQQQRK